MMAHKMTEGEARQMLQNAADYILDRDMPFTLKLKAHEILMHARYKVLEDALVVLGTLRLA